MLIYNGYNLAPSFKVVDANLNPSRCMDRPTLGFGEGSNEFSRSREDQRVPQIWWRFRSSRGKRTFHAGRSLTQDDFSVLNLMQKYFKPVQVLIVEVPGIDN